MDRQRGCVGRKNRCRFGIRFNIRHHLLLKFQVFKHSLYHYITAIKTHKASPTRELRHLRLQLCFSQNLALSLLIKQLVVVIEGIEHTIIRHIFDAHRCFGFRHSNVTDASPHQTTTEHAHSRHRCGFGIRTEIFFHLCGRKENGAQCFRFSGHHQFSETLGFIFQASMHPFF
ncbi:Uncharacterised protein [Vibrio cholerae]|nr:Uncharacterised protein [Vibrio cholerae]CSA60652.1 Uncharacterised protein [Vibrio cholerae]